MHIPPLSYQGIESLGGSHACDLEWAAGSGVLISSRSQPWDQPHTPQAEWRRALAPLGSPSGCCSFCPQPPCCSPGAVLVGTAVQREDPCWRDSELWHQTKASAWPRFRTCLGRTLGQPHCLILMGIACMDAWGPQPCRSFSRVLGQIGFLVTPRKALGQDKGLSRQGSTGPGLSLSL